MKLLMFEVNGINYGQSKYMIITCLEYYYMYFLGLVALVFMLFIFSTIDFG